MKVLEMFVLALSVGLVLAYICRLDSMRYKSHKLRVIVFHVALMGCAAAAGISAYEQAVGLQELAGLVASGAWIWISFPSWKAAPPMYTSRTAPRNIEPSRLNAVAGGKDS